jgi:hypothetical protein
MSTEHSTAWTPETRAAYAAGIIDGEGCIAIALTKQSKGFCLRLSIGQSEKGRVILKWFADNFNAKLSNSYRNRANDRQTLFQCFWSGKAAAKFIRQIQPYLIFKSKQAALALCFQDTVERLPKRRKFRGGQSETFMGMYKQMRELNAKGQHSLESIPRPIELPVPDLFTYNTETGHAL